MRKRTTSGGLFTASGPTPLALSETAISAEIADVINRRHDAYQIRVHSGKFKVGNNWIHCEREGTPDRFVFYRGLFVPLEIKKDAQEKPTPEQIERHKEIERRSFGKTLVAWRVEQILDRLREIDRLIRDKQWGELIRLST